MFEIIILFVSITMVLEHPSDSLFVFLSSFLATLLPLQVQVINTLKSVWVLIALHCIGEMSRECLVTVRTFQHITMVYDGVLDFMLDSSQGHILI